MANERRPTGAENKPRRTVQLQSSTASNPRVQSTRPNAKVRSNQKTNGKAMGTTGKRRSVSAPKQPAGSRSRANARPANANKAAAQANKRKSLNLRSGSNGGTSARAQMDSNVKKFKIVGIVLAALVVIYLLGALLFSFLFPPGTKMGSFDLSMKTTGDAEHMIDDALKNYKITVSGDGFSFSATADQTGLAVDTQHAVEAARADINGWAWPMLLMSGTHDETDKIAATNDANAITSLTEAAVNQFNGQHEAFVNANIAYDSAKNSYVVVPEKMGSQLDTQAVTQAVGYAIANLESSLELGDEYVLKPSVYSTDSRLNSAIDQANAMLATNLILMLDSVNIVTIDAGVLQGMIVIDADAQPKLSEEKFDAWMSEIVPRCETVGKERTYTRPDGKVCTVSGGIFGWGVDMNALYDQVNTAVKESKKGSLQIPCTQKGDIFTGAGERDWKNRYIDVDISEQHVRFYDENNSLIWESDCITGLPDGERDTVPGVWTVNDKKSPNRLIGKKNGEVVYETDVQFWMPFEADSIGFHDATWQPRFGGQWYEWGAGSHGCVNLPYEEAEALYGIIQVGDRVVVHH